MIPPGCIFAFGGTVAPTGYLLCGQAVSRTTFAALFAVLGTTYGPGNGTTTFDLPATPGRAMAGAGTGAGLTPRAPGAIAGVEAYQLMAADLPSLDSSPAQVAGYNGADSVMNNSGTDAVVADNGSTTVTVNTGSPNSPVNLLQPTLFCNWIIKT